MSARLEQGPGDAQAENRSFLPTLAGVWSTIWSPRVVVPSQVEVMSSRCARSAWTCAADRRARRRSLVATAMWRMRASSRRARRDVLPHNALTGWTR